MNSKEPKILSFVNLKGGVGKTALSVNFAAFCGLKGLKTLLIDMDPQTNATFSCISLEVWKDHSINKGTVANLMGMKRHTTAEGSYITADKVIIKDVFENCDLLPSHIDLFTIDLDMAGATARETKLKRALNPIIGKYDIIICDCPPNLTIPTQNALAISTHYAVPVSPDFLSAIGVGILLNRVKEFCDDLDHHLTHVGIIISRIGRPTQHRFDIQKDLKTEFGTLVLKTEINERSAVSEATAQNKPVYSMGNKQAKTEFEQCSEELLTKIGIKL
ncbi:MAG: AAA family ATPase [Pseudomonadota bacterium]